MKKVHLSSYKQVVLIICSLFVFLTACTPPEQNQQTSTQDGNFATDTSMNDTSYSFDNLSIPAGVTVTFENASTVNIAGDAEINGSVIAKGGRLQVEVEGDLSLSGNVTMLPLQAGFATQQANTRFSRSDGLYLIAKGNVNIAKTAVIKRYGPLLITDSLATLEKTPEEINAEAETASGTQPTLVPLPPDDPIFSQQIEPAHTPLQTQQVVRRVVEISGTVEDFSDLTATTTVHFRFDTEETDITLSDWEIIPTSQVNGDADDNTNPDDQGKDAKGKDGKKAAHLYIYNNQGSLTLNDVTINLGHGGHGGEATVNCANATGGDGQSSGTFRATARDGIDLSGPVTINPGRSGNGGNATATGDGSCKVSAKGGKGADNEKRLYSRGNVTGLANLSIGQLQAGNGGVANATTIGKAANGLSCGQAGKNGGDATATGGNGGNASLNVSSNAIGQGNVQGGNAGHATASAGNGGDGGDCNNGNKGGNGGDGGKATATAGDGGEASSSAGVPTAGNAGNATANAGDAGRGGHSCGNPKGSGGDGGNGGKATAKAGRSGDGVNGTTAGSGGDGGNGGDGLDATKVGAGGNKGEGAGTPVDIADGQDGQAGKPCQAANQAPIAVDDSASTQKEVAVIIPVLTNDRDPDGDSLSIQSFGAPTNGTAVKNADNSITYTPNPAFVGTDSFSYTITDGKGGTASATVTVSVSDTPVESYSLEVFTEGEGAVEASKTGSITEGSSVSLIAVPGEGYEFDSWTSSPSVCSGAITICNFTMPSQAVTVVANFKPQAVPQYTLTVTVSTAFTAAGGKVTGTNILAEIPSPLISSATFPAGTKVTLTATPDANSILDSWSVPCNGSSAATCTVTMNSNMSVNAVFTLKPIPDNGKRVFDAVGLFPQGEITPGGDYTANVYRDDLATLVPGSVGIHVQDVLESSYFRDGNMLYLAHGGFEIDFSHTSGIVTNFKVQLGHSCSSGNVMLRGFKDGKTVATDSIDADFSDSLEISSAGGFSEIYLEMDDSGSICLAPWSFSFTVK